MTRREAVQRLRIEHNF